MDKAKRDKWTPVLFKYHKHGILNPQGRMLDESDIEIVFKEEDVITLLEDVIEFTTGFASGKRPDRLTIEIAQQMIDESIAAVINEFGKEYHKHMTEQKHLSVEEWNDKIRKRLGRK